MRCAWGRGEASVTPCCVTCTNAPPVCECVCESVCVRVCVCVLVRVCYANLMTSVYDAVCVGEGGGASVTPCCVTCTNVLPVCVSVCACVCVRVSKSVLRKFDDQCL